MDIFYFSKETSLCSEFPKVKSWTSRAKKDCLFPETVPGEQPW